MTRLTTVVFIGPVPAVVHQIADLVQRNTATVTAGELSEVTDGQLVLPTVPEPYIVQRYVTRVGLSYNSCKWAVVD